MKLEIETPTHLIDVNGLGLDKIEPTPEGGLRIGALVRNTDLAADARVRRDYARAVARAARRRLRPAAQQGDHGRQPAAAHALPLFLRHQPAVQQTQPGSGCAAIGGFNRQHAVIGASEPASRRTRATWRSPCARSMRRWRPCSPDGATRAIPIADFHRLPGDTPHIETTLDAGELITAVTLPKPVGGTHIYRKVRDRASYAFALVSVAAIVQRGRHRARGARRRGAQAVARRGGRGASCRAAPRPSPARLLAGAKPTDHNAFKMPLVERTLGAVLAEAKG